MKDLLMLKGAKTLVDVATKVQTGEQVLIVTDYAKTDIAKAVASVACDRGGEVMVMSMKPRKRAGEKSRRCYCSGQLFHHTHSCG